MKVKLCAFSFVLLALFAGCKSPPKDTTAPPAVVEDAKDTGLVGQVESAREAAIAAKADETFPGELASVNGRFDALKQRLGSRSPNSAQSAELQDLLLRYQALEMASSAEYRKARVDGLEFAQYDNASYDKGEAALAAFKAADIQSESAQTLYDNALAARDAYTAVLNAGFIAAAEKARAAALSSKSKADSIKAGVAARDAYVNAGTYFRTGDENMANKLPEAALADFQTAGVSYEEIYADVLARRNAAQAAIQRAEQRARDVEAFAAEADELAPLEEGEAE